MIFGFWCFDVHLMVCEKKGRADRLAHVFIKERRLQVDIKHSLSIVAVKIQSVKMIQGQT